MALRTRFVKIGALLPFPPAQFGLVMALNPQLFGIVTAYTMMELKHNLFIYLLFPSLFIVIDSFAQALVPTYLLYLNST